MRLVPVIASIIFASALLGYGFAQAQPSTPYGTQSTASHPYSKICGDHPCKPGEVYNPGQTSANATSSTSATSGKNGTATGATSAHVNISANATATKTNGTATKGTMANATGIMSAKTGMSENATAKTLANMTKVSTNMTGTTNMTTTANMTNTATVPKPMESPDKQVASGTAPADVKCPTGFQLVLNKFDQRPACVTADAYAKLVARGWAS